jgi:hypothetical protein
MALTAGDALAQEKQHVSFKVLPKPANTPNSSL